MTFNVEQEAVAQVAPSVTRAGDAVIRLNPSERGRAPFRISAGVGSSVNISIDVPAGWRAIVPGNVVPSDVSPALRIASFFVPADAPAGAYTIRLRATTDEGQLAIDSVRVVVSPQVILAVEVEESPQWVLPRDTFVARFRVSNRGNVPLLIRLRLTGSKAVRAMADTKPRRLTPGAAFVVTVTGSTVSDIDPAGAHLLRLSANTGSDSATATARIEVLSQGEHGVSQSAVPATVRVRMSDNDPSVRFHASGPIHEGSRTKAEVLLQGPHTGYLRFGEPDIYRASLESRSFSLRVGDNTYGLSQLTEPGREGVGARGTIRFGPVETGGFFSWNRRIADGHDQRAAFARIHAGPLVSLGVNWLRHETGEYRREIVTAQGKFRAPGGWITADTEYGMRFGDGAEARSVNVHSDRPRFSVRFQHMRADSSFGGAYGGVEVDAGAITLRPWRRFVLEASADDRSSERFLLSSTMSDAQHSARIALAYGAFTAEVRSLAAARQSPWSSLDRAAQAVGARWKVAVGPLTLLPHAEIGRSMDRLTHADRTFWRGGTTASFGSSIGSYTASVDYFTGGNVHTAAFGNGTAGSLSATIRPTPLTRIALSATGARYFSVPNYASLSANASIEHQLPFGHTVALRTAFHGTAEPFEWREWFFAVDYRLPFRIPLEPGQATGSIRGRILDAETGAPLSRVIVVAGGRRTATDSRGFFELRKMLPGRHHLRIDRKTAGHRAIAEESWDSIDVRAGHTSMVNIPMTAAGIIDGRVVLVRQMGSDLAGSTRSEIRTHPLHSAVVEVALGSERLWRTTDDAGRFELSDLRPGRWAVSVINAHLPQYYTFEPETVFVDVLAGARATVQLRAIGTERRMQMVATAELTEISANRELVKTRRSPEASDQTGAAVNARTERAGARERGGRSAQPKTERGPDRLPPGWTTYTVPSYVTNLRSVAREAYLETGLWPKVWLANQRAVPDPDNVRQGIVLRIPPKAPLTNEEKRGFDEYMRSRW